MRTITLTEREADVVWRVLHDHACGGGFDCITIRQALVLQLVAAKILAAGEHAEVGG